MVCVTRSSSKHEGAEVEETIPPVRTRGRASTSRNAASTRRSRRTSGVEDSSTDVAATQGSEVSDHGSQPSTDTESRRNSASPSTLTSTPSRRLRRKRGSETGSCGSSTSITELQETSSAENPESDTNAGSATQETATAGKPPASPSRRRRGSSSSSQAAVTPSPARITRAMRKAGISTPKDVVELEIVPEEESPEKRVSKSTEKKEEGRISRVKSPAGGKKSVSPSKKDGGSAAEEVVALQDEPVETISSPDRKSASKAVEVTSPKRKQDTDEPSASPSKKSPVKKSTPAATPSPVRIEPEEAEKPNSSPSKKSPVKDMIPKDGVNQEPMDVAEQLCKSSPKKSPTKEVSPVKAAAPECVDLDADWSGSPARKSPSKRKSPKGVTSPEVPQEKSGGSPVKGSPVKEVPPEALPEIVSVEAKCSSSPGHKSPRIEKSPRKIVAPEAANLEEGIGIISPRKTVSDEATPKKTVAPGSIDSEADPMHSPTKHSPVKEVSPKNVLCFEEMDWEEFQPVESPGKKSPKKVLSPQKDRPEELSASSPVRKSPGKVEVSAEVAPELPEDEPVVVSPRKSPRKDVIADVIAVEEEEKEEEQQQQNIDEEGPVSPVKKTKESPGKDVVGVSSPQDGGLALSPKRKQSPSKLADAAAVEPTLPEKSVKKSQRKKLKKAAKQSAEPKATVEDEQEELSSQDGDRYVELESFKKLFKRPKYYTKACEKQLSALFTYACKLEARKNDLPLEFMNNDTETQWHFIAFRGKQISKEFRKRSGLLDVDLKLHGDADSSGDESDEDREENEFEEEHEDEEEEVEADLLNLKDEDLKDLEREMNEMREEEENEEEQDENTAPRKKYPKSVLDDKFFSLAEMNAFLDEQDRMEGQGTDILDTADDSWTGTADYCYEDFFGKKDAIEEPIKGKEKKLKKRTRTKESDKPAKKAKTVRFAMDEEQPETDGEAEGSAQEQEDEPAPVLLGDTEEPQEETSNLKKSLKRLKETIKRLEEENLAPKSWEMSGEVTAQQRGENELLETHLQFDHGIKKAPEITEVFTEKLEDLIKQRIKDKAFDDVIRKKRIEERNEPYRNQAIEEREMVRTSLAEVYEKEYQKAAGEARTSDGVNEEHVAIEKQVRELFRLIDALSNFDYTPPEVRPEVRVVSNMAALRVEEVGMNASTDAQLLAPEEMKKRQKGDLKADDERDRTDKLRQRRKKKNRQRAMVELFGEEKAMEGLKKKKKKVTDDGGSAGGEKLKSAAFFSKLQETVRNEIKEKTTKKKKLSKVKSQQVSEGGSKYLL
ncbi:hypothetical protein Y032_0021g447 [Ancylostoma ceylanicum]|uniref:Uncharacterized protein n=1 Tax=Ancylostoma ceylanicum TaxID=53326 RepID=A0A016V258_9BILA|nr:hypothetical protein Y032_0021g447 [Ancylostoma ceylanicum]